MRLPEISVDQLNSEQRDVFDAINSGPRREQMRALGLGGPFGVWVRAPALGGPTQALGAAVRYQASLPDAVREVAICTVGHFHRARFEFSAHREIAIGCGVDAAAWTALQQMPNRASAAAKHLPACWPARCWKRIAFPTTFMPRHTPRSANKA